MCHEEESSTSALFNMLNPLLWKLLLLLCRHEFDFWSHQPWCAPDPHPVAGPTRSHYGKLNDLFMSQKNLMVIIWHKVELWPSRGKDILCHQKWNAELNLVEIWWCHLVSIQRTVHTDSEGWCWVFGTQCIDSQVEFYVYVIPLQCTIELWFTQHQICFV